MAERFKYYVMTRQGNFESRTYKLVDVFSSAKEANACVNKDDRRERWSAIEYVEWKARQAVEVK